MPRHSWMVYIEYLMQMGPIEAKGRTLALIKEFVDHLMQGPFLSQRHPRSRKPSRLKS